MPVTGALAQWVGFSPDMLRASAAHFPGVGWLVGLAGLHGVRRCWAWPCRTARTPRWRRRSAARSPPSGSPAACTKTAWLTWRTAWAAAPAALEALEIMKDSRMGSLRHAGPVLALLAKVALLAVLAAQSPTAVLVGLAGRPCAFALLAAAADAHLALYRRCQRRPPSKPLADRIDTRGPWHCRRVVRGAAGGRAAGAGRGVRRSWPSLFSGLALLGMRRLFAATPCRASPAIAWARRSRSARSLSTSAPRSR